jgi:hypothetical protein
MSNSKKDDLSKKRKNDKIFNNGYKSGEAIPDTDYEYQSTITVSTDYSDQYMKDVYEFEESLDYDIGISKIFEIIDSDTALKSLLHKLDNNSKLKLSKEEVNWCFNRILNHIEEGEFEEQFYNPIYILEAISSILYVNSKDSIKDYKKIFDCLDVEIQESLIIELNKKYKFLEGRMNNRRIH